MPSTDSLCFHLCCSKFTFIFLGIQTCLNVKDRRFITINMLFMNRNLLYALNVTVLNKILILYFPHMNYTIQISFYLVVILQDLYPFLFRSYMTISWLNPVMKLLCYPSHHQQQCNFNSILQFLKYKINSPYNLF